MSEVVVSRRTSFLIAAACLILGIYCVQFSLIPRGFFLNGAYESSLLIFLAMTLANFNGVRFTGLNVLPPKKTLIIVFWGVLGSVFLTYELGIGMDENADKSGFAHLVVGLGLLIFFGLSCFGSFFSGFGMYLFLRNPISWAKNAMSRRSGTGN